MKPLSDPLSRAYVEYLKRERAPVNTIIARGRVLRLVGNAGVATREDIEEWWPTRADKSPATRANDLSNLRTFYKWSIRWEHRIDDPTARLDPPRVPNRMPRPMRLRDLNTLLEKLPADLRRAACLAAFASCRAAEAASLDWRNVDVDGGVMRVLGKGQKTRVVAVDPELITLLRPLDDDGQVVELTSGNIVTAGGKPMTASWLDRRVNRAIHGLGIAETFHTLRHFYGTHGYRATKDLRALADQMGHASINTTVIYAAAEDAAAKSIAAAVLSVGR
jgi:integrase/recombinase XerD